jgi:hypothetical protein
MTKIKLTFPNRLSPEEIEHLYSEYKRKYPAELDKWEKIERSQTDDDYSDDLRKISVHLFEFLKDYCEWDSTRVLSSVWMDMRNRVSLRGN